MRKEEIQEVGGGGRGRGAVYREAAQNAIKREFLPLEIILSS